MKYFLLPLVFWIGFCQGQLNYQKDLLGPNFEQTTIQQPNDYEGEVVCTLIRLKNQPKSRKAVLYIHGFNDYFFQSELAEHYAQMGYRFYAIDLRKYGRSYRSHQKLNNVRNLNEYDADIDTALKIIQAEGSIYTLVNGHSTGGLIAALYAHHHPQSDQFQALFLNSPFFDFNIAPWMKKIMLPMVAKKGKKKPNKLFKREGLGLYGESINKKNHGEWEFNEAWKPNVSPPLNYGWFYAIHQGHLEVFKGLKIDKPVLVMHSDHSVQSKVWTDALLSGDAVLSVTDIEREAKKIEGNCSIISIPNAMHDLILSKKEVRDDVYVKLESWLQSIHP